MAKHKCADCKIKMSYDRNPRSIIGRLWRWHIGFCPGWKAYFLDLPPEEREIVAKKYSIVMK
jgi:hypothetical protein